MFENADLISRFVANHPRGNIFQAPEMAKVYQQTNKYEPVHVTIMDKGELAGVLLAVIQKEHAGPAGAFSARSIIWGGPLVLNNDHHLLDLILKEYQSKIKGKAIYTQFRNLWEWKPAEKSVFEKNGYEYEAHLTFLIDLNKDEDTLWKDINPKGKNKIKKSIANGTSFAVKDDIESLKECYKVLDSVYKRAKLPIPALDFFLNLFAVTTPTQGLRIFVALNEGKIIGCRLALVYKKSIYDFFAGAYMEHYNKLPNDLIPWEVFKWGKANGYTDFDFGGAGKPNEPYGVREFKSKYGGQLVEFGRYTVVHKAALMKFGTFLMKVYKIMKGLKQ